jgi:hypothetical protein
LPERANRWRVANRCARLSATGVSNEGDSRLAYAGTYHVQGNEIILHVEISWSQTLTGTDQKRFFKLKGNRLTATTTPQLNAFLKNKIAVATLVWERVE